MEKKIDCMKWTEINPVADPDLQMRGWEGGCGHPLSEMAGGGGRLKIFFFWPKNKWGGEGGGAGPSPGSATAISLEILYVDLQGA